MAEQSYWRSEVSVPMDTDVLVRGYSLQDLIGRLPFTQAVYLLVRGELPTPQQTRVLDAALSAVLDYGLEKPGTAAARFAVSANPSMPVGLAAACMSVGEHTLATEYTSRFIGELAAEFEDADRSVEEFADAVVVRLRQGKRRIPGLGHPVFRKTDPRAQRLKQVAVQEGVWSPAAELYEAVHAAFTRLPGKEDVPINDVGVLAAVLTSLGFTPEEGTGLAVLSTLPGVIAHVSEELREGRPIRVIPRQDVDYAVPARDFGTDWSRAGWDEATGSCDPQ